MPLSPRLDHFVQAQAPVWGRVCSELEAGRKQSHWMWFVFPQIQGLGHSAMAQRYALPDLAGAQSYLRHPVLGRRIHTACDLLLGLQGVSAHDILGSPDDLKLRSSMTLFAAAAQPPSIFDAVLEKYFDGDRDPLTLERLS